MKIEDKSALLVIDIQQEDFVGMKEDDTENPAYICIRNAKKVLDVFRAKGLPVIQIKEVHRKDYVDFGRELDGSESVHCMENSPYTDYAELTYPIEGEYLITKRRYSAFFGTDLEILLKGLHVDTLYLIGGLTDVCIHYTAVDAHQHDYHIKVVTDAVAGSSEEAHQYALKAINCIRPFVIGRKNWLFAGSPKGPAASAGIYTLAETAKANGLAPIKYLKYILADMPRSAFLEHPEYLDDYLPWNPMVKELCQ